LWLARSRLQQLLRKWCLPRWRMRAGKASIISPAGRVLSRPNVNSARRDAVVCDRPLHGCSRVPADRHGTAGVVAHVLRHVLLAAIRRCAGRPVLSRGGDSRLRSVTSCGDWEGGAPAEQHASTGFRLGRSHALPKRRASVFGRAEYTMTNLV
jgi:hypothetical protein